MPEIARRISVGGNVAIITRPADGGGALLSFGVDIAAVDDDRTLVFIVVVVGSPHAHTGADAGQSSHRPHTLFMIRQLREARRQLAHGCLSGALGVYGEGVALLHVDAPRYREVAVVLQNQIDRAVGVQAGRDGHVALHHVPACGHIVPLVVAIEKILDNNSFQHRVFGAEALLAVRVQIAHGGLLDSVVHGNAQRPCVAALAVFCLDGEGGGSRRSEYAADFSGFFVQT